MLSNPKELEEMLNNIESWCNETAYPVQPIEWGGKEYSRMDAATKLFPPLKKNLQKLLKIQKEMHNCYKCSESRVQNGE